MLEADRPKIFQITNLLSNNRGFSESFESHRGPRLRSCERVCRVLGRPTGVSDNDFHHDGHQSFLFETNRSDAG